MARRGVTTSNSGAVPGLADLDEPDRRRLAARQGSADGRGSDEGEPRRSSDTVTPASVTHRRSAAGVRLGAARLDTLQWDGSFGTTLRKNGVRVKPKVGQVLSTSAIPGAALDAACLRPDDRPGRERNRDGHVRPRGSSHRRHAGPGRFGVLRVPGRRAGGARWHGSPAGPDPGTAAPYPDSVWELRCESPEGFVQAFRYKIPRN